MDGLLHLLTDDVAFVSDGGGKASAALHPLVGTSKVSRFLMGLATKGADLFTFSTGQINGQLGVFLFNLEGGLEAAFLFQVVPGEQGEAEGARIGNIYVVRNPDKLARLGNSLADICK
jgi:RNA polymerase sigma-70 factor (ECF subfamily)